MEFPTASLDAVPGDAEGGIEMTLSMEMLAEFLRMFTASGDTKANARIVRCRCVGTDLVLLSAVC